MRARLHNAWHHLHTSFWFVPAVMVTAAAGLAFAAVRSDQRFGSEFRSVGWLWGGSPDGAREVLSVIASSMITVAGVTFSVTVVALTMAASQFGPRLLRNFMRDTGNQLVLGTFVATFLYCLLVLRTVRSGGNSTFVPHLAMTVALALAVLAVGILIYFIHHVVSSLHVENLVASIAEELMETIDNLFPEELGNPPPEDEPRHPHPELKQPAWQVPARRTGYVQAVDNEGLMALATQKGLVVRLLRRPGRFVSEQTPLLEIRPADRQDEALGHQLARQVAVGRARTTTQDVEYPAQQVITVALRALSPAINDPVTAMICIDWLGSALMRLAGRKIPSRFRTDVRGRLRVVADGVDFAELTDLMFNPIRRAAQSHPPVLLRMLENLHALALYAVRAADRRSIANHSELIHAEAGNAGFDAAEMEKIDRGYRRVKESLAGNATAWPGDDGNKAGSDSA